MEKNAMSPSGNTGKFRKISERRASKNEKKEKIDKNRAGFIIKLCRKKMLLLKIKKILSFLKKIFGKILRFRVLTVCR
jgi:hypothetical protein